MYCVDTNIIVDYLRGNKEIKEKLERVFSLDVDVNITIITLCELYKGVFLSNKQDEELESINGFLDNFNILYIEKETAIYYGKIYSQLTKKGKLTQDIDLLIASVVTTKNQILITKNKKHFENIPELKLEVW